MHLPTTIVARGGGGGHASSHSSFHSAPSHASAPRASAPKATPKATPKSTTTPKTTTKTTAPKTATKTTAKPKTTAQKLTSTGAKGKAATTKPKQTTLNGHKLSQPQTVTHQHFHNYSAPAGSVVYYQQSSMLDYLPWIYLFSQNNSPNNPQAVVVQPDGKQVTTQQQGGVNGIVILDWVVLALVAAGLIAGAVYLVNKATSK